MVTDTDLIKIQLKENSTSERGQKDFIQKLISEWETGSEISKMKTSQNYYNNNNEEISKAERTVIGRDPVTNKPVQMQSTVLSNNKLYHPFLKKLVRQKISYMLGRPFTLSSVKEINEHTKDMFTDVNDILGKSFHRKLRNVCRDSIVKSIGWLQIYYDSDGELQFQRIPPEEVIPLWRDNDHTILDAVVRYYVVDVYTGDTKTHKKFIEYYDYTGVYYYTVDDSGKLVADTSTYSDGVGSHFYANITDSKTSEEKVVGVNWERIPFIPFKYDSDEDNLLSRIKSLVDDYDKKTSNVSNSIDDIPNSVTVIKNYDGNSKEEFIHNKNAYRTIFVQGDGDAKSLETPLDIANVDKHIARLREDIYEFGQGVDTQNKDIRDTSGVALRFLYADLDLDCSDWGIEVEASLMSVIWFVLADIKNKTGKDYSDVRYSVIFNHDMIVNETETITNCMNSEQVISRETIIANHPWTKEVEKEIANLDSDAKKELALTQPTSTNYGSGADA